MKKFFLTLLLLAFAGYCAGAPGTVDGKASIEPRKVYICLVTSLAGTEVITTQIDGDYYNRVYVDQMIGVLYSSQSHPWGATYIIQPGQSSTGMIEGSEYTYGAVILLGGSYPNYVLGRTINR